MDIQTFLISIGANMPEFKNGLIAGGVIVILVLIVVFVVSRLFASGSKSGAKAVTEQKEDNTEKLISSYEGKLAELKKENETTAKDKLKEGAVFSMVLLQREGRLVDFLKENIDTFEDAQIGAAVRQIHAGCLKVLTENFDIKPLFTAAEGETVTLDDNFDPSEVRMTGSVPGKSPYKGTLRHKGWIVNNVDLPTLGNPTIPIESDILEDNKEIEVKKPAAQSGFIYYQQYPRVLPDEPALPPL